MEEDGAMTLYKTSIVATDSGKFASFSIKVGLAQVLHGGAIFEVSTPDQAKFAKSAGACCISVVDPVSRCLGIWRMADPSLIKEIKSAVSLPVVAKARVGHLVEEQILESLGVDYVDENELLSVADQDHFINKHNFRVPFLCDWRDQGEALRRIRQGAAMIRSQGDRSFTGNVVEAVGNVRRITGDIRILNNMDDDEVLLRCVA